MREKNPPRFSIANGFALGDLPPCLEDVTITERRLTSLASFKGHTVIARGERHKFIKKSHACFFVTAVQNKRNNRQNYG